MKFRQIIVVAAALLMGSTLMAQTTFQVFVVANTNHPDPGAHFDVFEVDGVQGAELTLERGKTYIFQMNNTPALHPFFISTSDVGGDLGASEWTDGVTGNFATGNDVVTFVVPVIAPDLLYYQCSNHLIMGWKLDIINQVSVDDETPGAGFDLSVAYPNPSNNAVTIGLTLEQARDVSVEVFDVTGRRVAVLYQGTLAAGADHRFVFGGGDLPGGIYLIRATAGEASIERRVTLIR